MSDESAELIAARAAANEWLGEYGFVKYVGSGYEHELEGVDQSLIWTEWEDGLNGEWACNEFETGDEDRVPQGYYLMAQPCSEEVGSVLVTTTLVEDCDECDGDDEACEACDGDGIVYHELT